MTIDASAPDYVTALKGMLLNVTGAVAESSIYYPSLSLDPDAGTADTLPAWLITVESYDRTSYASGAIGLPGGQMSVTIFYGSATASVAQVQSLADTIATELQGQAGGLAVTNASAGVAQDATAPMQAQGTGSFVSCTITVDWGIS